MPPELKDKKELASAARTLAESHELVQRGPALFIPVNWQTYSPTPLPAPDETIWLPFSPESIKELANSESKILFQNDGEFRSFSFMLRQLSRSARSKVNGILIRTPHGIRMLDENGDLAPHPGIFLPNFVKPMLNDDLTAKKYVFNVISEWVGGDEQANSLLSHIATSLSPGYSAVKYIILLGGGRNGKGTLLSMIEALFGRENISNVTRQMMAESSPTCVELNDKLLNIVFDGQMSYIKDSSMEKTLIAGEPAAVRMLYESGTTTVQTNALFIEALQQEPKTRDKSSALQKRLVRFNFPNVYQMDYTFHDRMTSEPMLGALLSLLIDRYVKKSEVAEKLALTRESLDLQMEQVWMGNSVLQFLEHVSSGDPKFLDSLSAGQVMVDTFTASFKPWLESQGQHERSDGDMLGMLKTAFEIGWKTVRVNGRPTSQRRIKSVRPETLLALEQMKGALDDDAVEEAVGDGSPDEVLSELPE